MLLKNEYRFGFGDDLLYTSLFDYIERTKMNSLGTWGTDNEIIAYATMVQTNIMVISCQYRKWHCFATEFTCNTGSMKIEYLFCRTLLIKNLVRKCQLSDNTCFYIVQVSP